MGITILKNNIPWGPFTRDQIKEGVSRGDFTLQYLAHAPGLKAWLPLGEVLDHVDQSSTLPPVPVSPGLPPVPVSRGAEAPPSRPTQPPVLPEWVKLAPESPAPAKPPVLPRIEPEVKLPPAFFAPRAIAFLMDCAILFIPILFLFVLGAVTMEARGWWESADKESMHQEWDLLKRNFRDLLLLVAVGFGWLYGAGLECSRAQATLGKQWMGLRVTDLGGGRISFLRATGRHAAKYLSALPCFLGFIMALFSSRGLALHDRVARTRVLRK